MESYSPPKDRVLELGKLNAEDLHRIRQCRRTYNRLGFGYQIAFVRLENRFPVQTPFEVIDDLLAFVAVQTDIATGEIDRYVERQQTISDHQIQIREYLSLTPFEESDRGLLESFLFDECCRLEQTAILRLRTREYLRDAGILEPGKSILDRIIGEQRRKAREHIFARVADGLSSKQCQRLDALLDVGDKRNSALRLIKQSAGSPSASAMLRLIAKLDRIKGTGVLDIDLSWLNNNYQRALAKHARKCSAHRLKELSSSHRYTSLVCFLLQTYQDTVDFVVDMQDRILLRISSQAEREVDEALAKKRKSIQLSAAMLQKLGGVLLDDGVPDDQLRAAIFAEVPRDELAAQVAESVELLGDKATQEFKRIVRRYSYLRRYTPSMLQHLALETQATGGAHPVLDAVRSLVEMNESSTRKLSADTPTEFVPRKWQSVVGDAESLNRQAWECALLLKLRDEIKVGNLAVGESKRFGNFEHFFVESSRWQVHQFDFFRQAGLPASPAEAIEYLKNRLGQAYEDFLHSQPENAYATIDEDGWRLSTDPAEKHSSEEEQKLNRLKEWLASNMRATRLPDLLIEVDNELHFTRHFARHSSDNRDVEEVCTILATVMAHGCNIGPYTMAKLTDGISYSQIKRVTDWQLSEENQRSALADVVRAISSLGSSLAWGEGKASSSDGQRFLFPQKVLQRTFSHRMSDYALEFYSFVADNYAPFYSTPIECSDRDAAYVLDGLLYNESDLDLEEHYTDTHGYTEINFAAFAMLGKRFCPRIRSMHKQRIYRIDKNRVYGCLEPLVSPSDRTINLRLIRDHWERMGHFFASLESGHATASVALKRLAGYSRKNLFYRANRELGRVFKTEFILQYMSQSPLRRRIRRGLLKGEQLHQLARDVCYGKRGRISARDLQEQMNTCSCLTLILACIIYWQAREIERVITDENAAADGIDVTMLEFISPIEWENVLLYGEYVIDRDRIELA